MPDYGSIARVKQQLQPTVTSAWTTDQDAVLADIQHSVSAGIEREVGRTFGAPVTDTTQTFWAGCDPVLIFDRPARTITSVTVGGTVSNTTVTGGSLLPPTSWIPYPSAPVQGLVYGLRLLSGSDWGVSDGAGRPLTPVVVTADFADSDDDAAVPDDVTDVANYLIAETFKYRGASPAGFVGPDGSVIPIRNPWNDPLVKRVFDAYRIRQAAWTF